MQLRKYWNRRSVPSPVEVRREPRQPHMDVWNAGFVTPDQLLCRGFAAPGRCRAKASLLSESCLRGWLLDCAREALVGCSMARTRAHPLAVPPAPDEYPYSDGKIMAETPRHVDAILYALATQRTWFSNHTDASKRLTPDLFVVRGLEALPERSYKQWEEGRPPTFVLEWPRHRPRAGTEESSKRCMRRWGLRSTGGSPRPGI